MKPELTELTLQDSKLVKLWWAGKMPFDTTRVSNLNRRKN
jgi:hypothetical protein